MRTDEERAAEILNEIDDLIAELREITLSNVTGKPASRYPQFSPGERVIIMSPKLYKREATILRIKGEQMWHIELDDGTTATRKFSSLRRL